MLPISDPKYALRFTYNFGLGDFDYLLTSAKTRVPLTFTGRNLFLRLVFLCIVAVKNCTICIPLALDWGRFGHYWYLGAGRDKLQHVCPMGLAFLPSPGGLMEQTLYLALIKTEKRIGSVNNAPVDVLHTAYNLQSLGLHDS